MNSRQQTFLWRQLILPWLGPNRSHQGEKVTNGVSNQAQALQLASGYLSPAGCVSHGRLFFSPVSFQHVVVFMCQRVFLPNVWRPLAIMSRCSSSAVFSDMRYAISCAWLRLWSHVPCPTFTFFCFSFFPSHFLFYREYSLSSLCFANVRYVLSLTRQPANLPRQGTINSPHIR